jgi:hypothetical protein
MDEKVAFFQIGEGAVSMEVHEMKKSRAKHSVVERKSAA